MTQTRRRYSKKKGGNPEMFQYASLIKNKKPIDTDKFKLFLDSIQNPLFQCYDFDGNGMKYTINEYALIHESDIMVQSIFNNYTVDLEHLVQYSSLRETKINILEAYILHSKFLLNIQYILEKNESDNNYKVLFRYFTRGIHIPTVLMCAVEASKYKNSIFGNAIYQTVMELYSRPTVYNMLVRNGDRDIILQLFQFATMFNKPDFMVKIYLFLLQETKDLHAGLNLLFDKDIVSNILLLDDPHLYKTAIELMNYTDENIVKEILLDYANQNFNNHEKEESGNAIVEYLKLYNLKLTQNAKILFEKLGKHTIQNIILPDDNDKKIRIIIVCHGTTVDNTSETVDFPFGKLCFFVEKGEKLRNQCIVSRSIEELICAGNYDRNLKCSESNNNTIAIDNMIFNFENKTLLDKNNETTGFYICENKKVVKINILGIEETEYYNMTQIIGICHKICKQSRIHTDNVNLMFFACRGTKFVKTVGPEPILTYTHSL
jgi:hypothetical protein